MCPRRVPHPPRPRYPSFIPTTSPESSALCILVDSRVCSFVAMRRALASAHSASARFAIVLATAAPSTSTPMTAEMWSMVVGFSSGLFAAGTGLVAIGAYAASAEARLSSKADILEGKMSKEVAALKGELSKEAAALDSKLSKEAAALAAKLDGIKEAINDEVDAKMAGSEKTIDAKIAVFEKFAGGKMRPFPSGKVRSRLRACITNPV